MVPQAVFDKLLERERILGKDRCRIIANILSAELIGGLVRR